MYTRIWLIDAAPLVLTNEHGFRDPPGAIRVQRPLLASRSQYRIARSISFLGCARSARAISLAAGNAGFRRLCPPYSFGNYAAG